MPTRTITKTKYEHFKEEIGHLFSASGQEPVAADDILYVFQRVFQVCGDTSWTHPKQQAYNQQYRQRMRTEQGASTYVSSGAKAWYHRHRTKQVPCQVSQHT